MRTKDGSLGPTSLGVSRSGIRKNEDYLRYKRTNQCDWHRSVKDLVECARSVITICRDNRYNIFISERSIVELK